MPSDLRDEILATLDDAEAEALLYSWDDWARPDQLAPDPEGEWETWFIRAGRGWGKTRVGAETTRKAITEWGARRISLLGATAADVRDVMVEGESGLLSVFPPSQAPTYEPSKRRITFHNGATATLFSSEKPDSLRGPQSDFIWADEIAKWNKPQDTWDNAKFGLRLGKRPRAVVTSTLKAIPLVRALLADKYTIQTRGRTLDNAANLAKSFIREIYRKYEGTRLGRQELDGELLDDNPGAYWQRAMFDERRRPPVHPVTAKQAERYPIKAVVYDLDGTLLGVLDLKRVVVAIDPAVTSGEDSDETGIVVAAEGSDGQWYVLEDITCRDTPGNVAKRAIQAYDDWDADVIVAEVNNGGDYIEALLRTIRPRVSYESVHATRGKQVRAQPVASLYEQRRVWHVKALSELEDELCNWTPEVGVSPNRLDALVWAITWLARPHRTGAAAW